MTDATTNESIAPSAVSVTENTAAESATANMCELLRVWRIDDDVVTCRGCRRSLHFARVGETLVHATDCPNRDAEPADPWGALRYILVALHKGAKNEDIQLE